MNKVHLIIDWQTDHADKAAFDFELAAGLSQCLDIECSVEEIRIVDRAEQLVANGLRMQAAANAALFRARGRLCLVSSIWSQSIPTGKNGEFDATLVLQLLQGVDKAKWATLQGRGRDNGFVPMEAVARVQPQMVELGSLLGDMSTMPYETKIGEKLSGIVMGAYDAAVQLAIYGKHLPTMSEADRAAQRTVQLSSYN